MTRLDYARRVFTVDVRSLAVMRIAVAIAILVDLGMRLRHLAEHYSDDGVLPRSVARSIDGFSDVSLLAISGSPTWASVVFACAFGLAGALLVGVRTRLVTLLLWLVVLSIQHRNPLLSDHRDVLYSCALLYGLLLPWGAACSLDARDTPASVRCSGAPVAAYVILIASIYLCSALLKSGPEWRSDFTAVERAVGLEYWATSNARWLLDHPTLSQVLTVGVLVFEAAVAPLLLSPWRTRLLRWIAVIGLVLLQLGFAVFLWLDTFPLISTALTLGLVPWPRSEGEQSTTPSRGQTGVAISLIVYTLILNVVSLARDDDSIVRRPAQLAGIDQRWSMFAPSPSRLDGWFVVPSRHPDGTSTDLMTGNPVTFARPASLREGIRTTRELVYLRRLLGYEAARLPFVEHRCRTARPAPVVVSLEFIAVTEGRISEPEPLATLTCP